MQQLTGLDASFLALETANTTGHVGGLSVLDPSAAPEPLTLARLTKVMAERVTLVPVLRRKLLNVPLGLDQPYWVDDADFDIEYHVREIALPRPGSDAQLTEQVSRLHARPLDRSRPLWEIYLITGLAKKRAAVYTKIHHAAIDGASGAELLTVLLDLTPAGRDLPAAGPFQPASPPALPVLTAKAAARLAWRPVQTVRLTNELVKMLPTLAPAVSTLVGSMLGLNRGDGTVIATRPGRAPATPFNKPITPHRRFAFRSVSLDTVKMVKNAFGVSVNDVVMAMCAGALRRWLIDHDALPDQPLVAMIPVSVRDPDSKGAMGNRVSAMLAPLPTSVTDPGLRLEIVHAATKAAKAQQAAIPQGLVDQISDFAVPALTARAARVVFATGLLHRLPPFNITISNVPGPNTPVYLCGARLIAHYPVSVVTDGQGLNITLVGYLGQLHFGLVSCRELVPDLDTLAGYLTDELALLAEVADKRAANGSAANNSAANNSGQPMSPRPGDDDVRAILSGGAAVPAGIPAEIFAAAVDTFAAGQRLDMRSLARRLGVARATLYRRAGNRERLLDEMLWWRARRLLVEQVQATASLAGTERLVAVISGVLRAIARDRPLRAFLGSDPETALRLLTGARSTVHRGMASALEKLIDLERGRGCFDASLDTPTLAYAIVRISESFLYADVIADRAPDVDRASTVIEALLTGLDRRSAPGRSVLI